MPYNLNKDTYELYNNTRKFDKNCIKENYKRLLDKLLKEQYTVFIIEFGMGNGDFSFSLLENFVDFNIRFIYLGIDNSEYMIKGFKNNFELWDDKYRKNTVIRQIKKVDEVFANSVGTINLLNIDFNSKKMWEEIDSNVNQLNNYLCLFLFAGVQHYFVSWEYVLNKICILSKYIKETGVIIVSGAGEYIASALGNDLSSYSYNINIDIIKEYMSLRDIYFPLSKWKKERNNLILDYDYNRDFFLHRNVKLYKREWCSNFYSIENEKILLSMEKGSHSGFVIEYDSKKNEIIKNMRKKQFEKKKVEIEYIYVMDLYLNK